MALLFCDSFDHYPVSEILQKYEHYYQSGTSNSLQTGRTASAMRSGTASRQDGGLLKVFGGTASTIIIGAAIKRGTSGVANFIFSLYEGSTSLLHVALKHATNDKLEVYRSTTRLGVCSTTLVVDTWYYVELKVNISDTVGAPVVKINGVAETITWDTGGGSNQDTKNGGTGYVDMIRFGQVSGQNGYTDYDDYYICDSSGSTNNDFLGDVTVQALMPNGIGNYSQWTPTSGDNYTNVDENPSNDTDFVSASAASLRDSYAFENLSASSTIYGIQQMARIKKTTSGLRTVRQFSRLSSTDLDAGAGEVSIPMGYALMRDISETKPGGGGWDTTSVNDAEFGIRTVT